MLEGVCTCVTRRDEFFYGAPSDPGWVIDMLIIDKIIICRAPLPPLPEWLGGPWSTVRQDRVWQEGRIWQTDESCRAQSLEWLQD
jgi:hypothetical protein